MSKEEEIEKFWDEVGIELHKDISGYFKGCYYIEEALKKVLKQAELKGYQQAKQDFIKMIDKLLSKGLNGRKYNFMINGEELKSKLNNPLKDVIITEDNVSSVRNKK